MSENQDQDWVERAKRGDPAAVAELYRRYWRAARAAAYGVTGELSLAEDATSEAFCAALEGLAELRDDGRFGPWLRTIVIRTARHLRNRIAQQCRIESAAVHEVPPPGTRLEKQELAALVQEAVQGLPGILRETISLFYFEGYGIEEAARFLDIPAGTVKRRLHEGRRQLQAAAAAIAKGRKPMNSQRVHVLRRLQDLIDNGGDSDAVYQVMRDALALRPVPQDLVRKLMQQRIAAARENVPPEASAERERLVRKHWDEFNRPSRQSLDPEHPVGAAAAAILTALREFEERTDAPLDFETAARLLKGQTPEPRPLPPGFAEGRPVSYVRRTRGLLIRDADGSVQTQFDLFHRKADRQALETTWRQGVRISDVLVLSWLRAKPLELRDVEALLHRLAGAVVPGQAMSFSSYEEPRYRLGLRMQLGGLRIPAATGGILNPWPGVPEDVEVASVLIYLEAWATARSGQEIALAELPFPLGGQ